MKTAIYPGSFDPVTCGHLDVIKRAARLFDKLTVAVLPNSEKKPLFTLEERVALLKKVTEGIPNVEIESFEGLLADYARRKDAAAIVKGLRAVSDFELEFQMALANKKLNPDMDTVFLTTSDEYMYLSSSLVKEIGRYGGKVSGLIPDEILADVTNKFRVNKHF